MPPFSNSLRLVWPLALLTFAAIAVSVLWILIALHSGRLCGGMAVPVALACAVALRVGGLPRRRLRIALALAGTLLSAAVVAWLVIAFQIGFGLGLDPLAAAHKLGFGLFCTLLQLAATPADFIGLLAGLGLGTVLAK